MFQHNLSIIVEENNLAVNIIIVAFMFVIKFNSVLMTDNLFLENRSNFFIIIIIAREKFSELYKVITLIYLVNLRNHFIIFRQSRIVISTVLTISTISTISSDPLKTNLFVVNKVKEFRLNQKRSNMYVNFYYVDQL